MDFSKVQQTIQQQSQWKSLDPLTVVTAAREALNELPTNQKSQISGPIEEVLSRFEHSIRSAMGTSQQYASSGGGQQQQYGSSS